MSRICGIVAEYNPLHAGHLYHIEETRRMLGSDTRFIVVMSGHGVQRGEFPVADKAARTEMALRAGADLVFELPLPFSVAGAERFARAGISILRRAGITHLSFGSECGQLAPLVSAAAVPAAFPKDKSLAEAYPLLFPDRAELFTPNNILGIEYLRALAGTEIIPLTVKRRDGVHDGPGLNASAIRRLLRAGEAVPAGILPDFSAGIIDRELRGGRAPIPPWGTDCAFLTALRRLTAADFAALPEVTGGLENRLYHAVQSAGSTEELMKLAKTRRFTAARLRRAFFCAFLGLTEAEARRTPHLRLLGLGPFGRELLSQIREPILSRAAASRDGLAAEARATALMGVFTPSPQRAGREWALGIAEV